MNISQKKKLILGAAGTAGKNPEEITIDDNPKQNPDVLHDLNRTPWPFRDNEFREVVCHHVIEHLENISGPLKELHRVCGPESPARRPS